MEISSISDQLRAYFNCYHFDAMFILTQCSAKYVHASFRYFNIVTRQLFFVFYSSNLRPYSRKWGRYVENETVIN